MIWRHLVTASGDLIRRRGGRALTSWGEMPDLSGYLSVGVFVDTATDGCGRRQTAAPSAHPAVDGRRRGVFAPVLGRSVAQPLAGGRREDVDLTRPRDDVELGALLRHLAAVDPDDQVLDLAADLGGAVDVAVGAELLDDVDG